MSWWKASRWLPRATCSESRRRFSIPNRSRLPFLGTWKTSRSGVRTWPARVSSRLLAVFEVVEPLIFRFDYVGEPIHRFHQLRQTFIGAHGALVVFLLVIDMHPRE